MAAIRIPAEDAETQYSRAERERQAIEWLTQNRQEDGWVDFFDMDGKPIDPTEGLE